MKGQADYSPSGRSGNRLEVRSPTLDEVVEYGWPIVPRIPGDLCWRVDFYRHDLGDTSALNDDNEGTDTAALAAALLSSLDISDDKGIPDIVSGNDMRSSNGESGNGTMQSARLFGIPLVHSF